MSLGFEDEHEFALQQQIETPLIYKMPHLEIAATSVQIPCQILEVGQASCLGIG